MRRGWIVAGVVCFGCAKSVPVEAPVEASRSRPSWTQHLAPHMDAMRACLEVREAPRYVAFVDALPSGASGITTVDAYGSLEHCAYLDGRIVRRLPVEFGLSEVAAANQALFSFGPRQPVLPAGEVLEEVVESGQRLGWLFWPQPADETDGSAGSEVTP